MSKSEAPKLLNVSELVPIDDDVPDGFHRLDRPLYDGIDRKLGYFGEGRYVLFYYEPRGEEVIWDDGRSYGFGLGAWRTFLEHIEPLTRRYGVDLGYGDEPQKHALVIDRDAHEAYFARRDSAKALVRTQRRIPAS